MTGAVCQPYLVTGAAGFISRNVVTRLLQRGWRVKAMVPPSGICPRKD